MEQTSSSRLWTFIGSLVLLALAGAVVYGIYKSPGVVGSLATAAAAIGAVVYGQERQRRAEQQQRHVERMAPIYEELVDRFKTATTDAESSATSSFYDHEQQLHAPLVQ